MPSVSCGKFELALDRPLIMGVLNVTPDSFSGGFQGGKAVEHGWRLVEEGADILDIGGESTRPGAAFVEAQMEIDRVIPVIEALSGCGVPLSIDSYKPEVMKLAIAAGASMVNDINALQGPALQILADLPVAVCLMHKKGDPQTMQNNPHYENVVQEIAGFLDGRIRAALASGISRQRIVIDPGFGFGKTLEQNLTLFRNLATFLQLGAPVLVGVSRKSMLGEITGKGVDERIHASVAAALLAVDRGASIVRVHDVGATKDALKFWKAVTP